MDGQAQIFLKYMSNMVLADIEFPGQPVQGEILFQMGIDILNQILAQTLCFFRRTGVFFFIYGAVQMQDQFLRTERDLGGLPEMFGVNLFDQPADSGLQGVEGNPVVMKNIMSAGSCQFRQVTIIWGFSRNLRT